MTKQTNVRSFVRRENAGNLEWQWTHCTLDRALPFEQVVLLRIYRNTLYTVVDIDSIGPAWGGKYIPRSVCS